MASDAQDSFHIKDSISGESLFQCDGKAFSLHDRKRKSGLGGLSGHRPFELTLPDILDPNGKIIYNIGEKLISLHKTFVAEDENGREILRVKKHHSSGYTEGLGIAPVSSLASSSPLPR